MAGLERAGRSGNLSIGPMWPAREMNSMTANAHALMRARMNGKRL